MSDTDDHRPSPEALLEEAHRERRGKLKIFLGAAPGVGKTYEMLLSARRKRADGMDVVIGVVETHGRLETSAIIDDLEIVPRKEVPYKRRVLKEMDIDAILKRRPQLVLVDELAHSNAEGSRHPKRYQDVEELLEAGIDVYSTLNIQHIESLSDVVARITQVRVRETVPDGVFDTADAVELVDLTPEELIQRLREGRVYAEAQAQRAIDHYFKPGNLTALRELALRRTAERVDDQMRQYMRTHAIQGPWAAKERLLVCVNESPQARQLVRAAKRAADRIDADWIVIHIETARYHQLNETQRDTIAQTLRLAERLGGETMVLPGGRHLPEDILSFARDNNVTRIFLSKSSRPWWFRLLHGSVVHELVNRSSGIHLHIVSENMQEDTASNRPQSNDDGSGDDLLQIATAPTPEEKSQTFDYVYSALMVAAATLIGRGMVLVATLPNISLVFLAAVLWSATRFGLGPSLFASVMSTACYNYFFTQPLYTFVIDDPSQLLALVFFCAAAALTSTLTGRERLHATIANNQAKTTAEMYAFSRKLAGIRKLDTLLHVAATQVVSMLKVDVVMLLPELQGGLRQAASAPPETTLGEAEMAAAVWCWEHGQPTGRGTDTLPGGKRLFLPLRTGQGKVGVIGVSRPASNFLLTPAERRLLDALSDLAAIGTERIRLAKDVDQARMLAETEKLRGALLTSISHDLRTPLASIIGAISSLRSYGSLYDEEARDEMLVTALEEAERLNRYVANLLDMTQLEAGALEPKRQSCDLKDLVGAALRRTAKQLVGHKVKLDVPDSLPMLLLDDVLMEQVLVNLLDNAAKHTPAGGIVEISAARHTFSIVIVIRDEGPGVPEDDLQRIFDKFYRVRDGERSRTGTGLGLAICRGFVEAMGGRIYARNRDDGHGAEFIIELSPDIVVESPKPLQAPVAA